MTEQTTEVAEKPIQPEVASEAQPSKSYLKIVLLAVLGLIILAGAIYAGITIGKKQSPPKVVPQIVETLPTPDETANWKTYKNEKFGFEFKYPFQASIQDFKTENNISYLKTKMSDLSFGVKVENNPKLIIDDLNANKRTTVPLTEKNIDQIVPDGPNQVVRFQGRVTNISKGSADTMDYYILDNNNLVTLSGRGNIFLFDQILSTFKFLDSTSTKETANWETYRDSVASFEIKYPANWSYTIKSKTTTYSSPDQPNKPTYSGSLSFIGPEGQIDLVFGDGFGGAPCREAIGPSAQLIGVKIGNYTVHLCNYSQGGRTYYASPFGDAGGPTVANASYNFTFSYLESSTQSKDLILKILSTFKFTD